MDGALFFRLMGGVSAPLSVAAFNPILFFDMTDLSSVFQDSAGTIPVTGQGDPVGLVLDKSQMGNKTAAQFMADNGLTNPLDCPGQHLVQATELQRPTYQSDGSIFFDAVNFQSLGLLFDGGAGPASATYCTTIKTVDASAVIINANTTTKRGSVLSNGSSNASSADGQIGSELFIDNVDLSGNTRGTLHQLVSDGSWKLYREHSGDLSTWSGLATGDYNSSSFSFAGYVGPKIVLIDPVSYTANADIIDQWLAEGIDYVPPPVFDLRSGIALEGDSITLQNYTAYSAGSATNAIGFANWLMALSYRTTYYTPSNFYALGGGDLLDAEVTKETQIGTMTAQTLFLMIGTNDVPSARTLLQMQTAWLSIKDYTLSLGKNILAICIPPRTVDNGVALTMGQLTKLKDFNAWLETQNDPENGILVINPYDALVMTGTDDPNPDYFKNESGKLLHPNVEGAYLIAKAVWDKLKLLGYEQNSPPQNDSSTIITNTVGGTVSTNATGQVVDGFTLFGYGDNGVNRAGSVSADGQNIIFSNPTGGGSSSNYYFDPISPDTSFSAGDEVFAWAEITVHSANNSDGPFLELEETADTDMTYSAMQKAGNSTGYMPALNEKLLFTTVPVTLSSGHIDLKLSIQGQLNAESEDANIDMTVHNVGVTLIS